MIDSEHKNKEAPKTLGVKSVLPYFALLKPYWAPFLGALCCGVIYGVSS